MAYLILENGEVFEGKRIGAEGNALGEIVFTTGMTGYLETLTDPSYAGQIVVQTFPLIGNYGVTSPDYEGKEAGKSVVRGYVVSELCDEPSNFRCDYPLDELLKRNGIPGICGVDTRRLTRMIRDHGVMNAYISDTLPEDRGFISDYRVTGVLDEVSGDSVIRLPALSATKYKVGLIDYGVKKSICRYLRTKGCDVTVFPAASTAEVILAEDLDGIVLSNGPGDPAENTFQIEQIGKLLGKKPLMGICLGHQLTSLAAGGKTYKLKFGHRGANQPVKDLKSGRTYITSQNHGYAVDAASLAGKGELSFVNANDGSCEGMDYPGLNCFTVQFHPEAAAGPHDTNFLFDRFIEMMSRE